MHKNTIHINGYNFIFILTFKAVLNTKTIIRVQKMLKRERLWNSGTDPPL